MCTFLRLVCLEFGQIIVEFLLSRDCKQLAIKIFVCREIDGVLFAFESKTSKSVVKFITGSFTVVGILEVKSY